MKPADNQSLWRIWMRLASFVKSYWGWVIISILAALTSAYADVGQTIALVGPSGGGKSTILKLLLGYYPIQAGKIFVNGMGLGTQSLTQLRNLMAYVPQDAYLFDGTIEENIRFGNVNADEAEIVAAAKAAYAHERDLWQTAEELLKELEGK